ncbi:hypothetical protein [Limimaricola hongkongensis]|uniref:hypothetical protein n=1 Tax=Limimaricola hongkongensis TaxID=278132 RepID=UPI0013A54F9D|nr:hypothetical protein [Limimaricola hongkongensis]
MAIGARPDALKGANGTGRIGSGVVRPGAATACGIVCVAFLTQFFFGVDIAAFPYVNFV